MSDILNSANDNPETNKEKVPHSGDLGIEKPVQDFDNTTLETAYKEGLLLIPDDTGDLSEETAYGSSHEDEEKQKSRNKGMIIGGAIAGIAGVLGMAIGLSAGDDDKKSENAPVEAVNEYREPDNTTTTLERIYESGADYRTPEQKKMKVEPVLAQGTTAEEVVTKLYKNKALARTHHLPELLDYFYYRPTDEHVLAEKQRILDQENYYPEEIEVEIISQDKILQYWDIEVKYTSTYPHAGKQFTRVEVLRLVEKRFPAVNGSAGTQTAWAVLSYIKKS